MKAIKKAVEVRVWQIPSKLNGATIPNWLSYAFDQGKVTFEQATDLFSVVKIKTLEGEMEGKEGDYIIEGVKGELYPCRQDIFEETYQLIEEEK